MQDDKPTRLYFKTYLQMLRNAPGTALFRNFYIRTADGQEKDALGDGGNACAFFVSSVLTLFRKLSGIHGTVQHTIEDLEQFGWQRIADEASVQPGDVLVWEPKTFPDGTFVHIGFALGNGRAVSTSSAVKAVAEHDLHFGDHHRAITHIFRHPSWAKDATI